MAHLLRRIALLSSASISLWAFSGCLVVIRADTPGAHCGFSGSETTCGKCLAEKCQGAIDKCCSDDDCASGQYSFVKPFMELIDSCASGDTAVCAALKKPDDYTYVAPAKILSTCLSESCAAACAGSAVPHRECKDKGIRECSCSDAVASKGGPCSVASVGGNGALCLRSENGCSCAAVSCSGGTSCKCANDGGPGGFTGCPAPSTASGRCCLRFPYTDGTIFSCECDEDPSSCTKADVQVSACTEEVVRAYYQSVIVDKCDN